MAGKVPIALAAFAAGAAVATAGISTARDPAATAAVSFNYTKIEFAHFDKGAVRGIAVAGKPKGVTGGTINVYFHFQGLPHPSGEPATYMVAAVKRPCSRPVVDAADYVVWRSNVRTTDGSAFKATKARQRAPLSSARSIRAYDTTGGGFEQEACAPVERAGG
jgi:hypothetical protein